MSAQSVSEAIEAVPAERKAAVVDAMEVLLLADAATITVQVNDAAKWARVKAAVRPSKVLLIPASQGIRLHEAFVCRVGGIVYNLSGPAFYPNHDQHEQMLDDRDELDVFKKEGA